jgi:serine/threonine-protein phosphatase PGAM5
MGTLAVLCRFRPRLAALLLASCSILPATVRAQPPAAAAAPAARTLILVRHGHYSPDPAADARLGPSLSPLGVAQARLVAARLAGLPERFDQVFASPLTRAAETARVVAADLSAEAGAAPAGIETLAGLEECTPPTRRAAVVKDEPVEKQKACAVQLDQLWKERFVPAVGAERRELLVAHGNVIRYLVTKALAVDSLAWLEMSIGHTSMTTIRVEADGTFRVIAVGDVGHLPPNLQTGATGNPERGLGVPLPK